MSSAGLAHTCFLQSDGETCLYVDLAATDLLDLRSLDLLFFVAGIFGHSQSRLLAGGDEESARAVFRQDRNLRPVWRFDHCYDGVLGVASRPPEGNEPPDGAGIEDHTEL